MASDREQKLKIIDDAIAGIEKTYGKGAIMKLGDGVINDIEAIPTGALSLDIALGIGGIPRGCLLYTSDAADERSSVDLGGRRIIKKKNNEEIDGVRVVLIKVE